MAPTEGETPQAGKAVGPIFRSRTPSSRLLHCELKSDTEVGKDEKVARQFSVEKKEFASVREDKYDQERFEGSLIAVRELLGYFEEECSGDEALRETLTIACEGVFRQFHALERKCVKEKNKASRNTGGDDGREKQAS